MEQSEFPFTIQWTHDVTNLTEQLDRFSPDFIIIDRNLSSNDVAAITETIRNKDRNTPLVLFSDFSKDNQIIDQLTALSGNGFSEVKQVVTSLNGVTDPARNPEKIYRTIFENTDTAMTVINEDMTIMLVNSVFEEISGYSKAEIEGIKKWTEFIFPDDLERTQTYHNLRRIDNKKVPRRYDVRCLDRSGKIHDCIISGSIVQGTTVSIISLFDMTNFKKTRDALEETESRYRMLFENYNDSISLCDQDIFISCNPKTCQMFRCREEDIVGHSIIELFPSSQPNGGDSISLAIQKGKEALTGFPQFLEFTMKRFDGTTFSTEVSLSRVIVNGKSYLQTIIRDITERQKSQKIQKVMYEIAVAAHESENMRDLSKTIQVVLGEILDTKNFFIVLYDRETDRITLPYFSDEMDVIDSFPAGKTLTAYVIRNNRPVLLKTPQVMDLVNKGDIEIIGTPSKIWLGVPLKLNETVIGAIVVQNYEDENAFSQNDFDIMKFVADQIGFSIEYKRATEELQKAHAIYQKAIENAHCVPYRRNFVTNKYEFFGTNSKDILGISPQEMTVEKFAGIVQEQTLTDPEAPANINKYVTEFKEGKSNRFWVDLKIELPDGNTKWISDYSVPIRDTKSGKITGSIGILQDITERKQITEALSLSEKRFKELWDNAPIAYHVLNTDGIILDVNQTECDMLGYMKPEMISRPIFDFILPEQKSDALQRFATKIEGRYVPTYEERAYVKKNGDRIYVSIKDLLERDTKGKVSGIRTTMVDITERKKAEAALTESEKRYRTLFNSGNDAIFVSSFNEDGSLGKFIEVNEIACQKLGYSREELLEMSPLDFGISENKDKTLDLLKSLKVNKPVIQETVHTAKDGKRIPVEINYLLIEIENRKAILCISRDITERKEMEFERQCSEKLESIGILAGGIAHDFNNILTVIMGNITLSKMYSEPGTKVFERLTEAERGAFRAKDLTQQLLTFSRGGAPILKTASIKELLVESAKFPLTGSKVKCEFFIAEILWHVEMDEGQINQVIHNIVLNAEQAMPEGGIIHVIAENIQIGPDNTLLLKQGKFIKITIRDNGIGIAKEHLKKIFDPYFSTKSRGSGLGLTMVYSIIKNHNGAVTLDSKLGVGTTFYIYLPASEGALEKNDDEEKNLLSGFGKVLIMDDEELVREMAAEMLKNLGYEVRTVKDGAETIALYQKEMKNGSPFSAVIMDLTIPGGIGGEEALRSLLKIDPTIKAIVSSGYSNDPIMSRYSEYGFSGVVAKPYKISDLGYTLKKVMKK
ncbi:MAG: PAS domain S-box protein [Candidatus Neomarinimicrobiota bacterium]